MSAIEKYNERAEAANSLLCVGLDADIRRIPEAFLEQKHPQFAFNRHIIAATHTYAAAYKPNIAFYEMCGAAGLEDLRLTMDYLRSEHPDILTICDAKRGDIDSTNAAYSASIFDELGFDAITLHPYLGEEALRPFLERKEKGCIILCRTSNPGAGELQDLRINGKPLWQVVAETVVERWNYHDNCMLVCGATYPDELATVRGIAGDMPLLVPGIGAQGGETAATLQAGMDSRKRGLIINAARSIIFADDPGAAAQDLRNAINQHRR